MANLNQNAEKTFPFHGHLIFVSQQKPNIAYSNRRSEHSECFPVAPPFKGSSDTSGFATS